MNNLKKLKNLVRVLPVTEKIIEQALNSDFEDAIQNFTAVNAGIKIIITRNKSDYKKSKITVATAEEFLITRTSK